MSFYVYFSIYINAVKKNLVYYYGIIPLMPKFAVKINL